MFYTNVPEFVSVVARGKRIWLDEDKFNMMAQYRSERIADGRRYNTGPEIRDQFADAGTSLVPGGDVTVWELAVFSESEYEMTELFGKDWSKALLGESRPNIR